jgi:hypothetical protein
MAQTMSEDDKDLLRLGRKLAPLLDNPAFIAYLDVLDKQIKTRQDVVAMPAQTTELWVAQETVKGALGALQLARQLVSTIVREAREVASENEVDFDGETPTESK